MHVAAFIEGVGWGLSEGEVLRGRGGGWTRPPTMGGGEGGLAMRTGLQKGARGGF